MSIWDRILANMGRMGGPQASLLPPELLQGAGRQGLLAAGTSLLAGMAPTTQPRNLLADLGTALQAGQQAAQQGVGQGLQATQQGRELEYQQKLDEATKRGAGPEELLALAQQYGDVGMAQVAVQQLQQQMPKYDEVWNPETGRFEYAQIVQGRPVPGSFTGQVGAREQARQQREIEQGMMADDRRVRAEDRLKDDFRQAMTPLQNAAQIVDAGLEGIEGALARGENVTGADQILALYAFIRGIDPNSVVREGEARLAMEAQSTIDRIGAIARRATTTTVLPPKLIREMAESLRRLQASSRGRMADIYDQHSSLIAERGFSPSLITKPRWYDRYKQGAAPVAVELWDPGEPEPALVSPAPSVNLTTPGGGAPGAILGWLRELERRHGPGSEGAR